MDEPKKSAADDPQPMNAQDGGLMSALIASCFRDGRAPTEPPISTWGEGPIFPHSLSTLIESAEVIGALRRDDRTQVDGVAEAIRKKIKGGRNEEPEKDK